MSTARQLPSRALRTVCTFDAAAVTAVSEGSAMLAPALIGVPVAWPGNNSAAPLVHGEIHASAIMNRFHQFSFPSALLMSSPCAFLGHDFEIPASDVHCETTPC